MSCCICGRGSCTKAFHSIEEIEAWEELRDLSESQLMSLAIDLKNEVASLESQVEELEKKLEEKEDI